MYVDESGTPNFNDVVQQPLFVLTGLIINENDWETIENSIKELKFTYYGDDRFEIKSHTIRKGYGIFRDHSREHNMQFLNELVDLYSQSPITLINIVFNKQKWLDKYHTARDIFLVCYQNLMERYDKFLSIKNEKGLVILDARQGQSDFRVRVIHEELRSQGSGFRTQFTHSLGEPFFVDSKYSYGIQMADHASIIVNLHKKNNIILEPQYKKLYTKFYGGTHGCIWGNGLKNIPTGT